MTKQINIHGKPRFRGKVKLTKRAKREKKKEQVTQHRDWERSKQSKKRNFSKKTKNLNKAEEDKAPWMTSEAYNLKGMEKLNKEILDFADYIGPSQSNLQKRKLVVQNFKDLISKKFPSYKVQIFGSFETDLYLPDSDIDFIVRDENHISNRDAQINILSEIKHVFNSSGIFAKCFLICAKVPIIKAVHSQTRIPIDISANNDGYLAVPIFKEISEQYACFRPVLLLIKFALSQYDLNKADVGGVSTFVLFHLLVYLINTIKKSTSEKLTAAVLLRVFMDFFSSKFDYKTKTISLQGGAKLLNKYTKDWKEELQPHLLSVESFLDKDKDIGRNIYRIKEVKQVLSFIACKINQNIHKKGSILSLFLNFYDKRLTSN